MSATREVYLLYSPHGSRSRFFSRSTRCCSFSFASLSAFSFSSLSSFSLASLSAFSFAAPDGRLSALTAALRRLSSSSSFSVSNVRSDPSRSNFIPESILIFSCVSSNVAFCSLKFLAHFSYDSSYARILRSWTAPMRSRFASIRSCRRNSFASRRSFRSSSRSRCRSSFRAASSRSSSRRRRSSSICSSLRRAWLSFRYTASVRRAC
mmetsp:Transcript_5012/g.14457  ORF Transcript_5012/g.14457 Transcript_5012/m.14457 type:complete len:208 (-) Transcript_5012:364-987(-)